MATRQQEIDLGEAFADITDPEAYRQGVPHATFKRLRDEDPVSWWDETDGSGFWAVTRYDDLLHVSHKPRLFSTSRGIRLEDMDEEELAAQPRTWAWLWVIWFAILFYLSSLPGDAFNFDPPFDWFDKLEHAGFFFLGGLALCGAVVARGRWPARW